MAHFALVDQNNYVIEVCKVSNDVLVNENGEETEEFGIQFLNTVTPIEENRRWIQTSYNSSFRGNYAGIGMKYDEELDMFVTEKPYESWIIVDGKWEPPIERLEPNMDLGYAHHYDWDESTVSWKLIRDPEIKPIEPPNEGYYWILPEGEYDWVQSEIPPAPDYPPAPGFEFVFDHSSNTWIQTEVPVVEVEVADDTEPVV
jgi:hypothetical protein